MYALLQAEICTFVRRHIRNGCSIAIVTIIIITTELAPRVREIREIISNFLGVRKSESFPINIFILYQNEGIHV